VTKHKDESHDRRREADSWHLKKEINLSHILTTLTAIAVIFAWGSTVETRLAVQANNSDRFISHMESIDNKMGELVEDVGYLRGRAETVKK